MAQERDLGSAPQPQEEENPLLDLLASGPLQLGVSLIIPIIAFVLLWQSFIFMRDSEASKFSIGVVALIVGVFGVWIIYIAMNNLIERMPIKIRDTLRPYLFVGPAMVVLAVFLIYPAINTLVRSFMNRDSSEFVGLDHYEFIFTSSEMRQVLANNLLWLVVVTTSVVVFGLLLAVLTDRLGKRMENISKALIFLPMAISAVGASVIWKFMYHQVTTDDPQIGLLNAIRAEMGLDTLAFTREQPLNKYALMVIMIWLLTGFCMVILSAAVKGVPNELLEAARIDGANEVRIFFSVIIPVIMPTILTVSTTVLIMVLKVFDIVYVFGADRYGADVIANRMFRELFTYVNYGLGSALASLLLIAVLPIIFWNIRSLRRQRS